MTRTNAFLTLLMMLFLCCVVQGQEDESGRWINGISEPWWFASEIPLDKIEAVKVRSNLISNENQGGSHDWAGDYLAGGDTSGSFLRWSPQNGFVEFNVNTCSLRVRSFSYGKVIVNQTSVVFVPEYNSNLPNPPQNGKSQPVKTKSLFIKWRNVGYVVPEAKIENFGYYAAGSDRYEIPYFAAMKDTETGSFEDAPIFPAGYERFVRKAVEGKITDVGRRVVRGKRIEEAEDTFYESYTKVTLNIGSADGLKKWMSVYLLDSNASESINITKIGKNTSTGFIIRPLDEDSNVVPHLREDSYGSVLTVGTPVTTNQNKQWELQQSK